MPFAKTVEIVGTKNSASGYDENDTNQHYLADDSYLLEIDTSALFTVLFVSKDTFTDYDENDLVELDYTFLGDQPMLTTKGVWTSVTMTIPLLTGVTTEDNFHKTTLVIFVALGEPADAGLDGTLSLCVVPDTT